MFSKILSFILILKSFMTLDLILLVLSKILLPVDWNSIEPYSKFFGVLVKLK